MPLFNGGDPDGWIFRTERYFSVNGLTDGEGGYNNCMLGRPCPFMVSVGRKTTEHEDLGGFQATVAKPIPTHSRRVGRRAFFSSSAKRFCLGVPLEL